jgi:membrane-bound ClpP family serine protease
LTYPAIAAVVAFFLVATLLVWNLVPQPMNEIYGVLLLGLGGVVAWAIVENELLRGEAKVYDMVGLEARVTSVDPLVLEASGSSWQGRVVSSEAVRLGMIVRVVGRNGLTLLVEGLDGRG